MGRTSKQTGLQRIYTNGQQTGKNAPLTTGKCMVNIINHGEMQPKPQGNTTSHPLRCI